MNPIRILIVAGDPLARAGIATLLANQSSCAVMGQIAPAELADMIAVYRPDVMVWDFGANRDDVPDLREAGAPVVALIADANLAGDAWNAGARGLLFRNTSADNLAATIGAVAQGLVAFDPELANALRTRQPAHTALAEELTPRESQVLHLIAEGKSNKTIARELDISEHTVKFHVNAILGKLNAQSRTEAVVAATRLGLVLL
ncbi:Transcriptional regulatory protein DegU [Anaerolineae bacterium]|nr:Transcriptional regulatory protein DegU [Anaerolineae bacterium]